MSRYHGVSRNDIERRYKFIKDDYGDVEGKTVIDFGCAEGTFMEHFIKDGALSGYGIEIEDDRVNSARSIEGVECDKDNIQGGFYDIGLYLDLIFYWGEGLNVLDELVFNCGCVYVSPSGDGHTNSNRLERYLDKNHNYYEVCNSGFENRRIFRCWK